MLLLGCETGAEAIPVQEKDNGDEESRKNNADNNADGTVLILLVVAPRDAEVRCCSEYMPYDKARVFCGRLGITHSAGRRAPKYAPPGRRSGAPVEDATAPISGDDGKVHRGLRRCDEMTSAQ